MKAPLLKSSFQCTIWCILILSAPPARSRLSKMARMQAMKAMKASKASKPVRHQAPEAKVHFASGVPKVQKPGRKLKWVTVSAPAYISGGYSPSLVSLIHMHHSLSHTLAHPFIYKSHIPPCTSHTHRRRIVAQAGRRGAIGPPPNGAQDFLVNQEGNGLAARTCVLSCHTSIGCHTSTHSSSRHTVNCCSGVTTNAPQACCAIDCGSQRARSNTLH